MNKSMVVQQSNGIGKRVYLTKFLKVSAPWMAVFPLLCPKREEEWLDKWDYTMVYSDSGFAEEGCIFHTHLEGDTNIVWVVTRYEPENGRIEFNRFQSNQIIVKFALHAYGISPDTTEITINFTLTGLNEDGNQMVESQAQWLGDRMGFLEKSLNHYFKTGEILPF